MSQWVETREEFDEARRVAALEILHLLDDTPQKEFDSLVALAAELLGVSNALITLIDKDRAWVKASVGAPAGSAPRELAFCNQTVELDRAVIVRDAREDPRFAANPAVTGPDSLRFYAGVPIHAADSDGRVHAIGALCVIDREPRQLSEVEEHTLQHLANLAEAMIAARATALRAIDVARQAEHLATYLAQQDRIFRQAERLAMIGSWRLSLADNRIDWSDGVLRIHGLPSGSVLELSRALDFYPVGARGRVSAALARTIEKGEPFDIEEDFTTVQGALRRVRARGEREMVEGQPQSIVGVFQDITDRYALESALRLSADTDALTSLANRAAFDREFEQAIARAQRHDTPLMLVIVDLDGFKDVNDTLGHAAGDDVLRAVGHALRGGWLRGSFAARLGGDEFAVLVEDRALTDWPAMVGERLEVSLRQTITVGEVTLQTAGTVGWGLLDRHCTTARDFMHQVDSIMYAAKRARGGNRRNGDRRSGTSPGVADAPAERRRDADRRSAA